MDMEMEVEAFQTRWKEESENFVKEEFYESIRAPKWIDFTLRQHTHADDNDDDNAWFCIQAGCDQKHGTSDHSYLMKLQTTKSPSCTLKSTPTEGKPRVGPRSRTPRSAPALKGKEKMPGKAKPLFRSARKVRDKYCSENKDPNATHVRSLDLEMDLTNTEGSSTQKSLSNAENPDPSQGSPTHAMTGKTVDTISDINLTPEHQTIKATGAFSTPRIKKKHCVNPEPFRSIPVSSKVLHTTPSKIRSKDVAPRSISFQTPTKSVNKTPSKEPMNVTKHPNDKNKCVQNSKASSVPRHVCSSSRCAANGRDYSSPSKVSPKKYFASHNPWPSKSPLSRIHNLSNCSRPMESKTVQKYPASSHREALFSEQGNAQENHVRANIQKMGLMQKKIGTCVEGDTAERDISLQEKYADQNANLASADVQNCGSDVIKSESKVLEEGTNNKDEVWSKKPISMNHQETGNSEEKLTNLGCAGKETCPKEETMRRESRTEQCATHLASAISGERLTYGVNGNNVHKESESHEEEKSISDQDESDGPYSKSEISSLEDRENDSLSEMDVEIDDKNRHNNLIDLAAGKSRARDLTSLKKQFASESDSKDRNIEGEASRGLKSELDVEIYNRDIGHKVNNFVIHTVAEEKGIAEETSIRVHFTAESEANAQKNCEGKTEIEFPEDGANDGQNSLDMEPNDGKLEERTTKVPMDSAAENREVRGDTSVKNFASELEFKDKNLEAKSSKDLKSHINIESDNAFAEKSADAVEILMYSHAENERTIQESVIEVHISSEAGSEADFYLKNKQTLEKMEDHVRSDQRPVIGEDVEWKADNAVQLESDAESESKIPQKGINTGTKKCLQVHLGVIIQNGKEEKRASMQEIITGSSATGYGENVHLAWDSCDAAKTSSKSAIESKSNSDNHSRDFSLETGQQNCNGLQGNNDFRLPHGRDRLSHSQSDGAGNVLPNPAGPNSGSAHLCQVETGDKEGVSPSTLPRRKKRRSRELNFCKGKKLSVEKTSCSRAYLACLSARSCKVGGISAPHTNKYKKIKPTSPRPFKLRTEERALIKDTKDSSPLFQAPAMWPRIKKQEKQDEGEEKQPSKLGKTLIQGNSAKREKPKLVANLQRPQGKLTPKSERIRSPKPAKVKKFGEKEEKNNGSSHKEDKEEQTQPLIEQEQHPCHIKSNMPCVRQHFQSHRSTKRLTKPQEPKFHPLHQKKDCSKGGMELSPSPPRTGTTES